jgi:hypothetical protein
MSESKLWQVDLQRETVITLVVLAPTRAEARSVALKSADDAYYDCDESDWAVTYAGLELGPTDPLPSDWDDASIPWGSEDGRTIAEIREGKPAEIREANA